MAKIKRIDKLKDNYYIGTKLIRHNKTLLSTLLTTFDTNFKNTGIKLLKSFSVDTFENQTLGIDVTGYDFIIIVFKEGITTVLAKDKIDSIVLSQKYVQEKDCLIRRNIYKQETDVFLETCYGFGIGNSTGFITCNDQLVPEKVYGIKLKSL